MKLPPVIEVLNRTYKVIKKDMSEGNHIGRGQFSKGEICIDSNMDSQVQADTLLHEIIHLILIAMGREVGETEELHTEKNVLVIANGLSAFIRDNPGLMAEIQKGLK